MKYFFGFVLFICTASIFGQTLVAEKTLSADSAIVYYNRLLKKDKSSPFALYGLASVYFEKREFSLSEKYAKENIKNNNEYLLHCSIIYAASLDKQGRSKEAIKQFEVSLKQFPESFHLWHEYAFACYKNRDYEKALSAIKKALSIEPLSDDSYKLYGCILFEDSNSSFCIQSFMYALMLEQQKQDAILSIQFINDILLKKQETINIPFFDERVALACTEDILLNYYVNKGKRIMQQNKINSNLAEELSLYLKNSPNEANDELSKFYLKLVNENLTNAYSYLCLRNLNNEEVTNWIKNNSKEMSRLADFLEQNLIVNLEEKPSKTTTQP